MLLTTIIIQQPDGAKSYATIESWEGELPVITASREAILRKLPKGAVLVISGKRWAVVDDRGAVALAEGQDPLPGEVWRPKDPRRKTSFRIQEVSNGLVVTDSGRTIQLSRMKRYVRVS